MPYIGLRKGWIKECRRDSLTCLDWLLKSLMVSSGEITDCQICLLVSEDYTTAAWHVKVITSRFCFSSSCWKNKVQLRRVDAVIRGSSRLPHMLDWGQEFFRPSCWLDPTASAPWQTSHMRNSSKECSCTSEFLWCDINRALGCFIQLMPKNRQSNHNYYNCWI